MWTSPSVESIDKKTCDIELYSNTEEKDNIWVHIKEILKQDAYDVLWFFYVEQFSIKEIAKILQRSQSWVKISLYRSKKKLLKNEIIQSLSEDFI